MQRTKIYLGKFGHLLWQDGAESLSLGTERPHQMSMLVYSFILLLKRDKKNGGTIYRPILAANKA